MQISARQMCWFTLHITHLSLSPFSSPLESEFVFVENGQQLSFKRLDGQQNYFGSANSYSDPTLFQPELTSASYTCQWPVYQHTLSLCHFSPRKEILVPPKNQHSNITRVELANLYPRSALESAAPAHDVDVCKVFPTVASLLCRQCKKRKREGITPKEKYPHLSFFHHYSISS